jgi:hypothetical protein
MTINLTDVRRELKNVIKVGSPDVQVYDHIPDSIVPPCVVIQPPDNLKYHETFGGQLVRLETLLLKVTVIAESVSKPAAFDRLDDLISSDSPTSVKAAIEGSNLNGILAGGSRPGGTVHVSDADNFGPLVFNDTAFWSCDLHLEIQG